MEHPKSIAGHKFLLSWSDLIMTAFLGLQFPVLIVGLTMPKIDFGVTVVLMAGIAMSFIVLHSRRISFGEVSEYKFLVERVKASIPKGPYCYKHIAVLEDGKGIKIKSCPFWQPIEEEVEGKKELVSGYCRLLEKEDPTLLGDQCKICGINEDDE